MQRWLVRLLIVLTVAMMAGAWWRDAPQVARPALAAIAPLPLTTREALVRDVRAMEQRLDQVPHDSAAAVRLAQALIRVQRVDSDPAAAVTAEHRLRRVAAIAPENYEVQRMLGPVLLSQHRFGDALREAGRARAREPQDAWNYGVLGDAHVELGEYDAAFAAFDRMGALRPGPAAYARVAYALELKGDLEGALESLRMAADATSGHDPEAQAWHDAQLGHLLLQMNRLGDAKRHYERAALTFPDHPNAMAGLARIKIAEGEFTTALAMYEQLHRRVATPETAFILGDLHVRLRQPARAEARYVEGERLEREGWATEEPQPQALARFLAERDRNIPEAVRLAETAAAKRRDIQTMDALAWAYFKAGRVQEANRAMTSALRTGTRDARLLHHAAAIRERLGDREGGRRLRQRAATLLPEVALALAAWEPGAFIALPARLPPPANTSRR